MSGADPRSLLYRQLDPAEALALARETLGQCDDGELYMQFTASEAFGFDDGRLKTADYSRDAGFGLRGVSGEMTGFAHANEISAAAIRRAGQTLRLLDPASGKVEQASPSTDKGDNAFAAAWRKPGEFTYQKKIGARVELVLRRGTDETVLSRTWPDEILGKKKE